MTGSPLPPWAAPKEGGVPAPDSPLDRRFAAFIGPRWPTYRRKFRPFFEEPRFQPTWNWSAALATLFGPFWFVYRRLYVPAVLFWMLPTIGLSLLWSGERVSMQDVVNDTAAGHDLRLIALGVQLSTMILAGGTANFLLYRRARAAMILADQQGGSSEATLSWLARVGRVNWVGVAILLALVLLASSGMLRSGGAPR